MDGTDIHADMGFRRLVEAEVADQIDQMGADRSRARLVDAADAVLRAADHHELEPDDRIFWAAVADRLLAAAA